MPAKPRHFRTSLHEAGHALYCLAAGVVPSSVTLHDNGNGDVYAEFSKLSAEDRAIMVLCGPAAVELLDESPDTPAARMSAEDAEIYRSALRELPGASAAVERGFVREAEQFVLRNSEGIRQLAAALSTKRQLTPRDLGECIHSVPALFRFRRQIPKPEPIRPQLAAHRPTTSMPPGRAEFLRKNPHMRATVEGMVRRGILSR